MRLNTNRTPPTILIKNGGDTPTTIKRSKKSNSPEVRQSLHSSAAEDYFITTLNDRVNSSSPIPLDNLQV
jgi:hypothetical protein